VTAARRNQVVAEGPLGRDIDRGAASLWMLAFAMIVWASMAATLLAAVATGARHRVASAADLSALAAASTFSRAGPASDPRAVESAATAACAQAGRIAQANGASLDVCQFEGADVNVTASMRVPALGLVHMGVVSARARAGPA
jgi:secretion/DNA translocation related TadE-like protein